MLLNNNTRIFFVMNLVRNGIINHSTIRPKEDCCFATAGEKQQYHLSIGWFSLWAGKR